MLRSTCIQQQQTGIKQHVDGNMLRGVNAALSKPFFVVTSVVVVEESPCPRGTNYNSLSMSSDHKSLSSNVKSLFTPWISSPWLHWLWQLLEYFHRIMIFKRGLLDQSFQLNVILENQWQPQCRRTTDKTFATRSSVVSLPCVHYIKLLDAMIACIHQND